MSSRPVRLLALAHLALRSRVPAIFDHLVRRNPELHRREFPHPSFLPRRPNSPFRRESARCPQPQIFMSCSF
ncbi:hypothetical protein B0H10DRAFT_2024857 [Mycena sp. CBHHK59/15]|nr:hypothetical protein B0H10DRAFT_2024857 [Mycena sp. CBHHK59/15]